MAVVPGVMELLGALREGGMMLEVTEDAGMEVPVAVIRRRVDGELMSVRVCPSAEDRAIRADMASLLRGEEQALFRTAA